MAVTFTQTNTNPVGACNTTDRTASNGGTAGSTPVSVTVAASGSASVYFYISVTGATASTGAWTLRFNVTTANMNLTLGVVSIGTIGACNSSFNTVAGSEVRPGTALSSTGVITTNMTVTGNLAGLSTTQLVIEYRISNSAMSSQAFSFTPNQSIDSPYTDPNVTIALTTAGVTMTANPLAVAFEKAITGEVATASSGILTADISYGATLTGESLTASSGSLGRAIVVALSGSQITASHGTITVAASDVIVALTGANVTGTIGTLVAASSKALTTTSLTSSVGTLTGNLSKTLTGATGTATAGTLAASFVKSLSTASLTTSDGTLAPVISVGLSGEGAITSAGTISIEGVTLVVIKIGGMLSAKHIRRRMRRGR